MSGWLISFEGGEGAGKSTVLEAAADLLRSRGQAILQVREPGGTLLGEAIRDLLLDPGRTGVCAETELLLMFASRAQLVRETIRPALAQGICVLCDRFTDASFAYQGGGRGLPDGCIAELERWAVGLRPDLTFLLDVPVSDGLARARGRGAADRIEREPEHFFERVREAYLARARAEPARFRVIDARQPAQQVVLAIRESLAAWLERGSDDAL